MARSRAQLGDTQGRPVLLPPAKRILCHTSGPKGVVRQSREVRSHRQKQPLSEDKRAGQQRYQVDVSGGSECTQRRQI